MKRLSLLFVISLVLLPTAATPKKEPQKQQTIDLTGVWQVSGGGYDDGKEVCIKPDGQTFQAQFIYAGFCPYPNDYSGTHPQYDTGHERPYLVSGTLQGNKAKGKISACTVVERLVTECHLTNVYTAEFDADVAQDTITIHYKVDYVDYDTDKLGQWTNCRVKPNAGSQKTITLTRERCFQNFEDVCTYRVTKEEVRRAVMEACKQRHIDLPGYWERVGEVVGQSKAKNQIGFALPLEQYPIMLIGGVSVAPCMSPGGGSIIAHLMIWSMQKVNGKWVRKGLITEVNGSGDFNQKGLDRAIGQAFDAANIEQYKTNGPPS